MEEIAQISSALAAQSVQSQQGLAVLKQAMDMMKLQGQAAVGLIQATATVPAPGTGSLVDTLA